MAIKVKNDKFLKLIEEQNHPETRYYLIDSNKNVSFINGLTRKETFDFLVNAGIINISYRSLVEIGIVNIINTINSILDGKVEIGRFRFFKVTPESLSLEEQLDFNRRILLDEIKKVDWKNE